MVHTAVRVAVYRLQLTIVLDLVGLLVRRARPLKFGSSESSIFHKPAKS